MGGVREVLKERWNVGGMDYGREARLALALLTQRARNFFFLLAPPQLTCSLAPRRSRPLSEEGDGDLASMLRLYCPLLAMALAHGHSSRP